MCSSRREITCLMVSLEQRILKVSANKRASVEWIRKRAGIKLNRARAKNHGLKTEGLWCAKYLFGIHTTTNTVIISRTQSLTYITLHSHFHSCVTNMPRLAPTCFAQLPTWYSRIFCRRLLALTCSNLLRPAANLVFQDFPSKHSLKLFGIQEQVSGVWVVGWGVGGQTHASTCA